MYFCTSALAKTIFSTSSLSKSKAISTLARIFPFMETGYLNEVERITGIDFFPALDDEIETQVEAKYDLEQWELNR